jgi:hypothetical protein
VQYQCSRLPNDPSSEPPAASRTWKKRWTRSTSIGDVYAIAIFIWKVGAFKAPNGADIPAGRHRSTLGLAKGSDGRKVVHFHNANIGEIALKGAAAAPK